MGNKQQEIIDHLQSLIGRVPYVRGGSDLSGFDCYGFGVYAFALSGITVPRDFYVAAREDFVKVAPPARAFDVPHFRFKRLEHHVGVMIDSYRMVHASEMTFGVARSDITHPAFAMFLKGYYRHKSLCC